MTLPAPKIKLYHVPHSRSFRTLWLLNELGAPFELDVLPFKLDVLRHPDYLAISPLGRVPAVVMDGVAMFESGAVAQILATRFAGGMLARTPDQAEWPEWVQWIHYAETIAVHGAALVQQQVFIPEGQKSEAVQTLESKRLIKSLEVLNTHFTSRDWVLASGFSAADTSIGYSVHLANGFVDFTHLENVTAYCERCAKRPAFQAAVESKVYKA